MKNIYPFLIFFCFVITGCSKDFLKKYDNRIQGTWQLTDVDRTGIGGNTSHLPFTEGQFTFDSDGGLTYTNNTGTIYEGTWDIKINHIDENDVRSLLITAVDFTSQDVKSEYFDQILFTGTNRFKGYINSSFHTYVYHFKRQ